MTNLELLRSTIDDSGLKLKYIAGCLEITPYGLAKKLSGESEFKVSEANILSSILHLDDETRDDIFFAKTFTTSEQN